MTKSLTSKHIEKHLLGFGIEPEQASHTLIGSLSGGQKVKVVLAASMWLNPHLVILDEPTRGVDIGAKKSIYELIAKLSDVGESVLLVSSEIEEIIGMSNRVLVMSRGRLSAQLIGADINKKTIMEAAFKYN